MIATEAGAGAAGWADGSALPVSAFLIFPRAYVSGCTEPIDGPLNWCHHQTSQQINRGTRTMTVRFSQDVVPMTDLKTNPGRVVRHAAESHRPVLLTRRGRGIAVVQSVADYEAAEEERAFMRAVVEGLADLVAGRDISLLEAKARIGLV